MHGIPSKSPHKLSTYEHHKIQSALYINPFLKEKENAERALGQTQQGTKVPYSSEADVLSPGGGAEAAPTFPGCPRSPTSPVGHGTRYVGSASRCGLPRHTGHVSLRFTLRLFADTTALAVGGRGDPASASPSHPCAHTSAGRVRIDAAASHSIETVSLSLYLLRWPGIRGL